MHQRCMLFGIEMLSDLIIDYPALFDQELAVSISFDSQLHEKSSAFCRFVFRRQAFLDHGFDGTMHNGPIEA